MMLNEIYAGKSVIVPEQPVNVNGEDYLRWYVVDEKGNTIDWDENGMHSVLGYISARPALIVGLQWIGFVIGTIYSILTQQWKLLIAIIIAWFAFLILAAVATFTVAAGAATGIRTIGKILEYFDPPTITFSIRYKDQTTIVEKWQVEPLVYDILITGEDTAFIQINIKNQWEINHSPAKEILFIVGE